MFAILQTVDCTELYSFIEFAPTTDSGGDDGHRHPLLADLHGGVLVRGGLPPHLHRVRHLLRLLPLPDAQRLLDLVSGSKVL